MKKAVKCGQLFTAVDETVRENATVLLENDRIAGVSEAVPADPTIEVIDLSDKFVMPGLIDAHVHVNMDPLVMPQTLFSTKTAGDLTILSIRNAQANLMAGFTTIRDAGGAHFTEIALKAAIEAGDVLGPRMMVSGPPLCMTGGHADYRFAPNIHGVTLGVVCDGCDAVMAAARRNIKYGADQIKLMATGGVMSFGNDPKCSEFTLEEMRTAVDIATGRGKITSAHAHGSDGIKIAVRAGITSIEHGMLMDDECIELMLQHGTYLIPTIIAGKSIAEGAQYGLPAWMVEKSQKVLDGFQEKIRLCRKAGIKIGFGTDAGTSYNIHGKQTREFSYMQEFGFAPAEILTAATRVNASMMRWDDRIGTVEPGKLADLVAYDESPLKRIKTLEEVSFVMKSGTVVKKDRQVVAPLLRL